MIVDGKKSDRTILPPVADRPNGDIPTGAVDSGFLQKHAESDPKRAFFRKKLALGKDVYTLFTNKLPKTIDKSGEKW